MNTNELQAWGEEMCQGIQRKLTALSSINAENVRVIMDDTEQKILERTGLQRPYYSANLHTRAQTLLLPSGTLNTRENAELLMKSRLFMIVNAAVASCRESFDPRNRNKIVRTVSPKKISPVSRPHSSKKRSNLTPVRMHLPN